MNLDTKIYSSFAKNNAQKGNLYMKEFDLNQSFESYLQSLKMKKQTYGNDNVDIANSYYQLASNCLRQHRLHEGLIYTNKALEIYSKFNQRKHPTVALCYQLFGNIFEKQMKIEKAIESYQKAIEIIRDIFGLEDYRIGLLYEKISAIKSHQSQFDDALDLSKKASAIYEKHYDVDHFKVNVMRQNVRFLSEKKRINYSKSPEELNVSKDLSPKGNTSRDSSNSPPKQSANSIYLPKFSKKVKAARAIDVQFNILTPKSEVKSSPRSRIRSKNISYDFTSDRNKQEDKLSVEKIANYYLSIGKMNQRKGLYDLALKHLEKAAAMIIESIGKLDLTLGNIYSVIGEIYFEQKKIEDSAKICLEALYIFEKLEKKLTIKSANVYLIMAKINKMKGNLDRSIEICNSVVDIFHENSETDNTRLDEAFNLLADLYMQKKDDEKAAFFYSKTYEMKIKISKTSEKDLGFIALSSALHFDKCENFEQAFEFSKKAHEHLLSALGVDDPHTIKTKGFCDKIEVKYKSYKESQLLEKGNKNKRNNSKLPIISNNKK